MMRRRFALCSANALLIWSGVASAQSRGCTVAASNQTVPGRLEASLQPMSADPPPRAYTTSLLNAIALYYHPAGRVTVGTFQVGPSGAVETAFTSVVFAVTMSGRVRDAHVVASSLAQSFDDPVLAALRAASDSNSIPGLPVRPGLEARYELRVALNTGDTIVTLGDTASTVAMTWFATSVPVWSGASPAVQLHPDDWRVRYPELQRRSGVEDSLVVQFVISADGRVTPGTLELLHAGYRDFLATVASALTTQRFTPATINGCPVAALVAEPFAFKLTR